MNVIKSLYHWSRRKADKFLLRLCREDKLWLAVPLSSLARTFFLREFASRQVNYRSIEELKQLVFKATGDKATKFIEDNKEACAPSNLKVLIIFPKYVSSSYVNNGKACIETTFEDVWVKTAKAVGLIVDIFYADKISYISPSASNHEILNQERIKLLLKVKDFQPQLIFLDINYRGNPNTINCEFLQEIKRVHNCKIAGHMGDYLSNEAFRTGEYWAQALDIVLHSNPEKQEAIVHNVHYMHFFVNELSFYPTSEKRWDITFSGSGNISRYVYLAVAKSISKKRGYKSQINVHSYDVASALSQDEYPCQLRESRAVLSLSARPAPGIRVLTGRVQEAIASKSLVIEEKNDAIERIFIPYAHFIPFDSERELEIAIEFSVGNEELVDKITQIAYVEYCRAHRSKIGWSQILSLCQLSNTKSGLTHLDDSQLT